MLFLENIELSKGSHKKCRFLCECGNITIAVYKDVVSGHTKSCGCIRKRKTIERFTTHGKTDTRLYNIWTRMKARCYNPDKLHHNRYRARGIEICNEWLNDFQSFYDWSMNNGYKDDLQIDRIDNNGNYKPNNCRWVTQKDNNRNRSSTKLNLEKVKEIRDMKSSNPKITLQKLSEIYGVSRTNIGDIINNKIWI